MTYTQRSNYDATVAAINRRRQIAMLMATNAHFGRRCPVSAICSIERKSVGRRQIEGATNHIRAAMHRDRMAITAIRAVITTQLS